MVRRALIGAGCGVGLLSLTWVLAFHVGVFGHADQSIFNGFGGLDRPRVDPIANFIANLCNPRPYVYLTAVPVLIALFRRRPRMAVAVAAILLGSNLTTELLKPLLAEPRPDAALGGSIPVGPASWPSGHATAAMSLALCFVLAVPWRLRPLAAALGAGFAIAVSYSFLTLGWHYPSDVFGGFLVAGIWTLLVVAAVSAAEARWPRTLRDEGRPERLSIRQALGPSAAVLAGAFVLVALVAIFRPHAVLAYARYHEVFTIGAIAIGALGVAVATGVMLAVRR